MRMSQIYNIYLITILLSDGNSACYGNKCLVNTMRSMQSTRSYWRWIINPTLTVPVTPECPRPYPSNPSKLNLYNPPASALEIENLHPPELSAENSHKVRNLVVILTNCKFPSKSEPRFLF